MQQELSGRLQKVKRVKQMQTRNIPDILARISANLQISLSRTENS